MKHSKVPEPIFTATEVNRMVDRIMIQISNVVTEEIAKKSESMRVARHTARKIIAMDQNDWMSIDEVSQLVGVSRAEVLSKVSRLNLPFMDHTGAVRRHRGPLGIEVPRMPTAVGRDSLYILVQSFNSEKGHALREYTALAMIYTMQEVSKI